MMQFERLIEGAWVHSHEEDHADSTVYRKSDYELPPSRGRYGMTFSGGGVATLDGPGPDDRSVSKKATWTVEGGHLVVAGAGRTETFRIEHIDQQSLVLSRIEAHQTQI